MGKAKTIHNAQVAVRLVGADGIAIARRPAVRAKGPRRAKVVERVSPAEWGGVESLTALLCKYAERVRRSKGKTQAQIARDAWLGESYVSRLFSGQRVNPSRDALVLLGCWGLELAVEEMDELLMLAEYRPLVLPASIR